MFFEKKLNLLNELPHCKRWDKISAKSMRLPYQVLVFPFIKEKGKYYYAIFKRKDLNIWQGIAGGGEGKETPLEAMRREAYEEATINKKARFIRLSSLITIPAVNICGLRWGNIVMIPEFSFGVEVETRKLKISNEHKQYLWVSCQEAINKLKYDSNKSAIWELDYRLKNGIGGIKKNIQSIKKFL